MQVCFLLFYCGFFGIVVDVVQVEYVEILVQVVVCQVLFLDVDLFGVGGQFDLFGEVFVFQFGMFVIVDIFYLGDEVLGDFFFIVYQ